MLDSVYWMRKFMSVGKRKSVSSIVLAIYFSHHDIYAAENYHHVGHCVPQA
jgi:hypothetical protein